MVKRVIASVLGLLIMISALTSCSALALKQLEAENESNVIVSEEDNTASESVIQETVVSEPKPEPEPEPEPVHIALEKTTTVYTITFAGDCTLGGIYEHRYSEGTFDDYVGENYDYPFEHCLPYFENDDLTMVNLECVLSTSHAAVIKKFRLIGSPEYAKVLTAGNVEVVNLANNHTYDFGTGGFEDTKTALESENVKYVEDEGTLLYTTNTGLVIGFYSAQFNVNETKMREGIQKLRDDGAEIIIFSYHGGIELSYRSSYTQEYFCRGAIDAGADIVFGHHAHVLQPVEEYNGGIIYYSLGNFAFGGNGNPQDYDTAIIQQKIVRDKDGNVSLGETVLIPFNISSTSGTNDYKPVPLEEGTDQYDRCMEKLKGTYTGPDLQPLDLGNDDEEEEETEEPENPVDPQLPEEGGETPPTEGEGEGSVETPPPESGGEGSGESAPSEGGSDITTPPETENTDG